MDSKWYYAVDGVRHGPVSFDEIRALARSGALKPLDLVWHSEFGPEWRNAGHVRELFEAGATAPALLAPDAGGPDVPLVGVAGAPPSCFTAASQALARTAAILFRPFDPVRWFSIGFCAWLAYIGTQVPNGFENENGFTLGVVKQRMDQALDQLASVLERPAELVGAAILVLCGLLVALWLCWLRSRGDFMFLHRWYRPDASVRQCWQASRAAGRELFAWRVYFFLIACLLFALQAVFAYAAVVKPYLAAGKVWNPAWLGASVGCATGLFALATAVQLVAHLTKAFVVPVIYWRGVSAARAWLVLFALCNQYPLAVIGYLLCGMALSVAAVFAILAFGLLTCCVGFIPLAVPCLNMVMLLPFYLFFRGYSICFINQWRPELIPASA